MTEQEWLACTDPKAMLDFLRGKCVPKDLTLSSGTVVQVPDYPHSKTSHRKLRLFACECCRRIWHLLRDQRSRTAVEVSERYADGQATEQQLRQASVAAEEVASAAYDAIHDPMQAEAEAAGLEAVEWIHGAWELAMEAASAERAACDSAHLYAADLESWKAAARAVSVAQHDRAARAVERQIQAVLFRCIMGNPFLPMRPHGSWVAWNDGTIRKMAQAIYDERAFDRLPLLADALEDAGCTNAEILAHCRGPGPHVRGCWVVDLVLGKN